MYTYVCTLLHIYLYSNKGYIWGKFIKTKKNGKWTASIFEVHNVAFCLDVSFPILSHHLLCLSDVQQSYTNFALLEVLCLLMRFRKLTDDSQKQTFLNSMPIPTSEWDSEIFSEYRLNMCSSHKEH